MHLLSVLLRRAAATNRHELEGEQCLEAIQPGPCRGSVRRWAFNAELGRCAPFWWGGCQPNGNNFLTKAACNKTCRCAACSRLHLCPSAADGVARSVNPPGLPWPPPLQAVAAGG